MRGKPATLTGGRALLSLAVAGVIGLSAPAVANAAPGQDKKLNLSAITTQESHDRFIVHFDAATRGNSDAVRQNVADAARGQGVGLQVQRQLAVGAHVITADSALPPAAAEALMRRFASRAEVEYVEPDVLLQPMVEPTDPLYYAQWHYNEVVGGMNLPGAWDLNRGLGVVVAVLDTGQTDHEDLVGNMVPGYDFIDDTFVSRDGDGRDGDPDDPGDWTLRGDCGFGSPATNSSWHGTHVAGTVAAVTNNGIGLAGVAYEAKVQHVRVLGRCGGYLSDISDGVVWASGGPVTGAPVNATPASVINMSLGGSGSCGTTYQAAIDEAVANGATVVVSAGNSNADAANFRPASCANVITVAATDRFGDRASYSNYGATVEISAPGGDSDGSGNGVASTLNDGTTVQGNDIYVYYQGTSMAAPHISGLAAMMYSTDPAITPAQVLSLMQSTARPLPGSCTGGCGAGIADAEAALLAMGGGGEPPPPPPPPPPADEPPAAPSNLVADAVTSGSKRNRVVESVTLTWNDNSGNETGFEIQACVETGKGRDKQCPYTSVAQVGVDVTSWVDTSGTDGRRYQVRALGDAGNSAWSNEASF